MDIKQMLDAEVERDQAIAERDGWKDAFTALERMADADEVAAEAQVRTLREYEWADRIHYTVFDADPDYASDAVEGVLVPWASSEWSELAPPLTSAAAVRHALIDLTHVFPPPCEVDVVLPLPHLAAWALRTEFPAALSVEPAPEGGE